MVLEKYYAVHDINDDIETCYYVEFKSPPTNAVLTKLNWLLTENKKLLFSQKSFLENSNEKDNIIEFGPNLSVTTPWSTNAMTILESNNIDKYIERIEKSYRTTDKDWVEQNFDIMIHQLYDKPLETFQHQFIAINEQYQSVFQIADNELHNYSKIYQLGLDDDDIHYYRYLAISQLDRELTNAELLTLAQINNEHCRHRFFNGKFVIYKLDEDSIQEHDIDKIQKNMTGAIVINYKMRKSNISLMDIVKTPYNDLVNNSHIAFEDNASGIQGFEGFKTSPCFNITNELTKFDDKSSEDYYAGINQVHKLYLSNRQCQTNKKLTNFSLKAETHNFPTLISPFQGGATGVGGRIRDTISISDGGMIGIGMAGYCVGNLDLMYPWETTSTVEELPNQPVKILIDASDGASDYSNKVGEPVILGFMRSFGAELEYKEVYVPPDEINDHGFLLGKPKTVNPRIEWLKPIMFSGGIGTYYHTGAKLVDVALNIVRVGGPAYRIGIGGGIASSRPQDASNIDDDYKAVQRADPEMEAKVIKFINHVRDTNDDIIFSIQDQGAGGMANTIFEIVEELGAEIDMDMVYSGDVTLSIIEKWLSEHQEQVTILVQDCHIDYIEEIAERENVPVYTVGRVSNIPRIIANNSSSNMIDLPVVDSLSLIPRKEYKLISDDKIWISEFPNWYHFDELTFRRNTVNILNHPQVGSKKYLTNKADRSVSGLVSQQQCVGIMQLPLSDFASMAHSYYGNIHNNKLTVPGVVTAIGEQPIKGIHHVDKMVRLTIAEMLTNMIWGVIEDFTTIKCSANWMWDNSTPQNQYLLYRAVNVLTTTMNDLNISVIGGKDSLSMSYTYNDTKVSSPNTLVLTGYATSLDVQEKVNPCFIERGTSIIYVNLSKEKYKLGGSTLSIVTNNLNNVTPDDIPDFNYTNFPLLFAFIQFQISEKNIISGHDVSDGGLITALLEMSFGNNIGFHTACSSTKFNANQYYFNEDPGLVFECYTGASRLLVAEIKKIGYHAEIIGQTSNDGITITFNGKPFYRNHPISDLRTEWETTSFKLEEHQTNKLCIDQEIEQSSITTVQSKNVYYLPENIKQLLSYMEHNHTRLQDTLRSKSDVKLAVIREEGSNGDRELISVFNLAGFDVYDIHMNDILHGKVVLDDFMGIAFVGGFSNSDVFGAGNGWASTILNNEVSKLQFQKFKNRKDTFSFGICNGCQLMASLGWVPYNSRFVTNNSGRFESRYSFVTVTKNRSIMLKDLEGLKFGIWSAHGEGKYTSQEIEEDINKGLFHTKADSFPLRYIDYDGNITINYPHNPNGSPEGIASIVSSDGRHLAMMPHPERCFMNWQHAYLPPEIQDSNSYLSPWFLMFRNAYSWCQRIKHYYNH